MSAYVHLDEVTPHIHFAFCPVVRDQKKDRLKVSAKECISRVELKRFHPELDEYLTHHMGERYAGGILNEATKEGNKSIDELKRKSATDRLAEATVESQNIVATAYRDADEIYETAMRRTHETENRAEVLQEKISALQSELSVYEKAVEEIGALDVPNVKKSIGGKKITMPTEDYEKILQYAKAYFPAAKEAKEASDDARKYKSKYEDMREEFEGGIPAKIRIFDLEKENNSLSKKLNAAKKEKKAVYTTLHSDPRLIALYLKIGRALGLIREKPEKTKASEKAKAPEGTKAPKKNKSGMER